MSFSIGSSSPNMGPRGALEGFGNADELEGTFFNGRVVLGLIRYFFPYGWQILFAFLAMLVTTGLTLLVPYLLKIAIDTYITAGDAGGLVRVSLYMAAAFAGLYVFSAVQQYLLSRVSQRVLANLRGELFQHLQMLSIGYHDTHIIGVTVSRIINDVAVINDLLAQGWINLLGDLLILVGIIVVMLTMSLKLALLTFIVLPLMALATWLFAQRARVAFRETRSKVAAVIGDLAEDIAGMRVIQAFAQENSAHSRFKRVNVGNRDAYINAMSLSFVFLPSIEFLGMLATGIVLWFGGQAVTDGAVTLGVMVAFLSYVTRFFQPIQELSRIYTTMQSAMAGGERVLELLETPPDVQDRPGAAPMPPIRGKVELDEVSFRYRKDTPEVLHQVSLRIQPGQTVALVGPTGAGKSSIANLVGRFYEVTGGAVRIDDIDVRDVTQQSLHRQVGLVPQELVPVPRHGCREHPLWAAGCAAGGGGAGGPDGQRARVHRRAAGRLRDRDPGGWGEPVGGAAPTAMHRARAADRPAHPDPGRGHGQRGHGDGVPDPRRAEQTAGGPHSDHHRPPAEHDPQRGHDLRGGRREDRGARPARRTAGAGRGVPDAVRAAVRGPG